MKICPTCNKTYTDDGLNFCLDDGSQLTTGHNDLPETMILHHPGQTVSQPGSTMPGNVPPTMQSSWSQTPNYTLQPQKKSSAWKWILGLVGIAVFLCGGGLVGLLALGILVDDTETDYGQNNSNTSIRTNSNTDKNPITGNTIPLEGWINAAGNIGEVEYTDGELIMSSRSKQFYLVLLASSIYSTDGVTTSVSVRNIDNAATRMGYGLVFHSDPTPLKQAYAFLIDTKLRRFRIVRHLPKQEIEVVRWTDSTAIKGGTEKNILEVKDNGSNIDLFINSTKVNTIKNTHGFKNGVPGLYSGEGVRAAFSDLNTK